MFFKAPYVIFRNGHPYFMIRVPSDLTHKFNKKFIRKALKTQNSADAKMLAEAFASVHFPILPVLHRDEDGELKMYKRNAKLITPKDFDYSPYFDVIKYPILDFDELAIYRKMPWGKDGVIFNDSDEPYVSITENKTDSNKQASDMPDDGDQDMHMAQKNSV